MIQRRVITFTGRVQGVGFRMTTLQLAEGLALSGTVRNTDDGAVELDVEGENGEIDTLLTRLSEHFGSFIRNMTQRTTSPTGRSGPGIRISH